MVYVEVLNMEIKLNRKDKLILKTEQGFPGTPKQQCPDGFCEPSSLLESPVVFLRDEK